MPAFTGGADLGNNGGASASFTGSFPLPAGSNLLVAGILGANVPTDDLTSAAYGGSAMTLAAKLADDVSREMYLYFLENPPTGTNNLVVTAGSAHYIYAVVGAWSGFAASGQPDVTNTNVGSTIVVTNSFTTTQPNDWAITVLQANGGTPAAASGLTLRVSSASIGLALLDSAGPLGAPGLYSVISASSPAASDYLGQIAAAFIPFAGTPMTANLWVAGEVLPSIRKSAPHQLAFSGSMQRDD
jgi:hypothetical protein